MCLIDHEKVQTLEERSLLLVAGEKLKTSGKGFLLY